jgi:hypothetical protein
MGNGRIEERLLETRGELSGGQRSEGSQKRWQSLSHQFQYRNGPVLMRLQTPVGMRRFR